MEAALPARQAAVRPRFRIPVSAALVGASAALMALAVGGVLLITFLTARANTLDLLRDRAELGLELLETRVRGQLDPVAAAGSGLGTLIGEGELDTADEAQVRAAFQGALAAVPQATAVVYVDRDLHSARVSRGEDPLIEVIEAGMGVVGMGGMMANAAGVQAMLQSAAQMNGAEWLAPLWVQSLKQPVLNLEVPVNRDGEFLGVLFVVVQLGTVVDFLARLEIEQETRAFVLYGRDRILAHPDMRTMMLTEEGGEVALPPVSILADPAVVNLARGTPAAIDPGRDSPQMFESWTVPGGFLVTLREIAGYGPQPWQIALTFDADVVNAPLRQLQTTAAAGLGILAVAMLAALWMSRALARRIEGMCDIAYRLARLDVASCEIQPDSRIQEFHDASEAFGAMTAGLRWFETYVPKKLVLRLMQQSAGAGVGDSEERVLTVMFTDIRGFSTMSERKSAAGIAELLNRHFEIISTCIEAEGGTVDKYIGDSVMAFWGAPERDDDHALRAVRAAAAIRAGIAAENRARRAGGEDAIFVRVGLHTGPVVVGNIGSASRLNYTVVGDTVNAASRLESLAKDLAGIAAAEDDCVVLFSDSTEAALGPGIARRSLGSHTLRGREKPVEVFQLAV